MVFGDYELLEEIAHGGMGVVFKARQVSLDRIVAVKMLLFGWFADQAAFQRFRAEAQNAARLQHPNIVAIREIGEQDGQPFYAMEYVEGQNLAEAVRDYPLPSRRAASYLREIARAVQYAHDQGILHRDLRPANILIDPNERPRITDFGLARRVTDESHLTLTGQVLGSPNFMPPEQAGGGQSVLGPASDIYSLGALLYYLLTGRPPFVADTFEVTLARVLNEDPLSPRRLNPSVPKDLETICLRCLEKDPQRRLPSAQAMADELDRFLQGQPLRSRPITGAGRAWRWACRKPALAAMATGMTLALLRVVLVSVMATVRIARALEVAQREAYFSHIRAADAQIKDGKIQQALETLWRCPEDLRHWEWGRLLYLCHQDIVSWQAHSNNVVKLEFDPSGQRLLSRDTAGTVMVWDWMEQRLLLHLGDPTNRVLAAALDPHSRVFVDSEGVHAGTIDATDHLVVWHEGQRVREMGRLRRSPPNRRPRVFFSPQGRWLCSAGENNTARMARRSPPVASTGR